MLSRILCLNTHSVKPLLSDAQWDLTKVSDWEVVGLQRATLAYINIVTVPHEIVGLERMSDYSGITVCTQHLL